MFSHLLVPIDCTDDTRRLAEHLTRFVIPLVPSKLTLAAVVTPTDDPVLRGKRRRHAEAALLTLHTMLLNHGVWARTRVLENEDHAAAYAIEGARDEEKYDLLLLGTHQTRPEDLEAPCRGSFADQLCQRTHLPVLVLPSWQQLRP